MLSTLHNKALAKRRNADQGFTLIELLVVIVIIGILAAIAIPAFLNQRAAARDASVTSDVRNAATEVQTVLAQYPDATYFAVATGSGWSTLAYAVAAAKAGENESAFVEATHGRVTFIVGNSATDATMVVANLSGGGKIAIKSVVTGTPAKAVDGRYVISGYNPSGKAFNSAANAQKWDSGNGGLQK